MLANSSRPLSCCTAREACAPRHHLSAAGVIRARSAARRTPRRVQRLEATLAVEPSEKTASSTRNADTRLGELFLNLLPGSLYYAPALLYPLVTALAGLGAAYAPPAVQYMAALPAVRALGPLSPLLAAAASRQPWATLLSVFASLLTAQMGFVVMPALDWLLGQDLRNPSEDEAVRGLQAALYRAVLYAYVPLQLGMLGGLCYLLSAAPTPPLAFLGVTISTGVAGGIMFTAAHELLHGSSWVDRMGANLLLATVGYMHWGESHLAHHVKVATPEDPASARRGESLYAFIPRSVWGNLVDGYSAEAKRLERRGIPLLNLLQNRMVWWVACPLALAAAAFLTCGWRGLAFFVVQAALSVVMLEVVNYIEHYGLQREKLENGRYERCGPQHSWNTSYMMTNAASFRLQRHADHHQHASKPFHLLRDSPESPQLPFSYPLAMLLATVPPLFMSIMDAQVDAYTAARAAAAAQQLGQEASGEQAAAGAAAD